MTSENNSTNVLAAFEILLEELEAEIEFINKAGSISFESRDYERARGALERVDQATAFRDKISALRSEWEKIAPASGGEEETEKGDRRSLGRLRRGVRTRETAYFKPILMVLNQMGGTARVTDVLERLQKVMKGILREVDYEPLVSDPELPRWQNTAQWARNSMVQAGLLKSNSPRGVWEISEAGMKMISELEG